MKYHPKECGSCQRSAAMVVTNDVTPATVRMQFCSTHRPSQVELDSILDQMLFTWEDEGNTYRVLDDVLVTPIAYGPRPNPLGDLLPDYLTGRKAGVMPVRELANSTPKGL